jgi:nucleoside-diphosphate-sugar epimerase
VSNESNEDGAILITGGTGFIGSHLARKLVAKGNEVVLFDYRPNENRISDFSNKVEIVKGDIATVSDVVDTLKDYKIKDVFHTAFAMSAACESNMEIAYATNIRGTYNLLDACRILGINKFIFLSSLSVFGSHSRLPFTEETYRDPASFYGVGKVWGEILGMYYHYQHELDFRCIRFAVVVGPGRRGAGAAITYSTLIENAALGKKTIIQVPDYTILPVIYIDDVVNLLISLWTTPKLDQYLFMSGGVPVQIQDLISEVKNHIPSTEASFDVDPDCEKVAETWTLLTSILVQKGEEKVYREIPGIGWKMRNDSMKEIVRKFIENVQLNMELYSSF